MLSVWLCKMPTFISKERISDGMSISFHPAQAIHVRRHSAGSGDLSRHGSGDAGARLHRSAAGGNPAYRQPPLHPREGGR